MNQASDEAGHKVDTVFSKRNPIIISILSFFAFQEDDEYGIICIIIAGDNGGIVNYLSAFNESFFDRMIHRPFGWMFASKQDVIKDFGLYIF